MLSAEHITVRYGEHTVVEDLSFRLEEGQWLMLVGPNGAGKSTLIEAMAQGVPYEGTFLLEGRDMRKLKPAQLARRVGILAQKNAVGYAYSVEEVVRLGRYAHASGFLSAGNRDGEAQVEQALAFVQGLDIRTIACRIMQELFRALAMRYDFSPQGLLKETEIR